MRLFIYTIIIFFCNHHAWSQKTIRPATKSQPDIATKVISVKTNIITIDSIFVESVDGEELTVFMPETLIKIRIKGNIAKHPEGIPYFDKINIVETLTEFEERNSTTEVFIVPEINTAKVLKSPFFKEEKDGTVSFDFKTDFVFKPSSWGTNDIIIRCGNKIVKKTIIQKKR